AEILFAGALSGRRRLPLDIDPEPDGSGSDRCRKPSAPHEGTGAQTERASGGSSPLVALADSNASDTPGLARLLVSSRGSSMRRSGMKTCANGPMASA